MTPVCPYEAYGALPSTPGDAGHSSPVVLNPTTSFLPSDPLSAWIVLKLSHLAASRAHIALFTKCAAAQKRDLEEREASGGYHQSQMVPPLDQRKHVRLIVSL